MNNHAAAPLAYRVTPSDHARSAAQRAAILDGELGFGNVFTDHMVSIQWARARGWHDAEVHAYGPLALDPAATRYEIVAARHADGPMQIALQGRSLLAVMFFLSQSVEAPAADREAGNVTSTREASGALFDWSRVVGAIIHVRTGDAPAHQAAVQVAFRGHWFWIDDNDLTSKSTLALLRLLLFLKSGDIRSQSPLLTIPTR